MRTDFLDRYAVRQAGGRTILEYWIPAADLDALNDAIVGTIEVVARFHGDSARRPGPDADDGGYPDVRSV